MEYIQKFVNFGEYCKRCQHFKTSEWMGPCNECLNEPVNLQSEKPVCYAPDEKEEHGHDK